MTTRRGGVTGAEGAGGAAATGWDAGCSGSGVGGGAETATGVGAVAAGGAGRFAGFTATGACGGVDATAGAGATTGGRVPTGAAAGRGVLTGETIYVDAAGRGMGTMRRGAGAAGAGTGLLGEGAAGAVATTCGGADTLGACRLGVAGRTATGGLLAGGATVTAGRGGGAERAAFSACFRSRIALSASPGLETCERSNLGLISVDPERGAALRTPRLK